MDAADDPATGRHVGDLLYLGLAVDREQRHAELESLGWEVRVLDGLDHLQAMQAKQVVPILRSWLCS